MNNINIKGLKINNTQEVDSILGSIVGGGESNAIPTTQAVYNLVSNEISVETSGRQSTDTSLSTAVSTRISVDNSLSTALSTEISSTNVDVTSLSTAISTANSTRVSVDTSLSTAISTRISVDGSLSTSINTKLSVSGGTVSPSFYINGLSNNATSNYIIYYNEISSGITYGLKPSGGDTYTFTNGLTNNSGVVSIGGTLTSTTYIDGGQNLLFGNFYPLSSIEMVISSLFSVYVNGQNLQITTDGCVYSDSSGIKGGIKYSNNYSAYYTNRSLVDKEYVDSVAGGGTPGGSDTYVQFNDGGTTFGGHSGLIYSKITGNLTSSGLIKGSNIETNPTSLSVKIGIEAGKSEDQSASRRNIYIGFQSGQLATNGATDCVSIGYQSLFNNTTGDYNISIGTYASFTNGTGHSNVVLGYNAAFNNTSGSYSVYIGRASGEGVSTGSHNSCVGYGTGQYLGASTGNVLFGSYAGAYLNNTAGAADYNCFIGFQCASSSNISGDYNIGIGYDAFSFLTTGSYNIGIGNTCLTHVTTGTNNTSIGLYSGMGGNVSNSIYLGAHAGRYEGGSNKLFIDSLNRTDESTARISSPIYGIIDSTVSNQEIYLNSKLFVRHLTSSTQSNVLYYNITTKEITYGLPGGNGTVTSVAAGNGMNFSNITTSGTITLGTPSTITSGTTNLATTGTHTHQISGFLPLSGGVLTGTLSGTSLYLLNNIATNGNVITNGNTRGATLNGAIIRNGGYSLYFPPNGNGQSETLYKFPTTDDCVVLRFIVEGTIIRGEGKFGGFKIEGTASKSGASYYFITTPVVTTDFEVGLNVTSVSLQIIGSNIELSVSVSNYNYWTMVSATLYGNQISRTIIGTGQQII